MFEYNELEEMLKNLKNELRNDKIELGNIDVYRDFSDVRNIPTHRSCHVL